MKAIFLCEGNKIFDVYRDASVARLKERVELDMRVWTKEEVMRVAPIDCDFIFSTWGMPHFTDTDISFAFPKLKAVFYGAGSVQSFAHEFIERGVCVYSAWAANAIPVCEYAVSQILLANKGYFHSSALYKRTKNDEAWRESRSHIGNYGARVGLLGLGMIGSTVARELKRYSVDVLAYDPFCTEERASELGVRLASIDEVFEQCDTVSNHIADNAQTKGVITYELLSKMKKGATLINTGRGAQIDEGGLARVLAERPDIFAVLDVTTVEPLPESNPLYFMDNVVLTPHIAGSLGGEVARMGEYMTDTLLSYLDGDREKWRVTAEMLKTMA